MKKIVYIAHPISGDIEANLADLRRILRIINTNSHPMNGSLDARLFSPDYLFFNFENIIPIAPYYADIVSLDDNVLAERARGIENDTALIKTGVFKELWLTGNMVSYGMKCEKELFESLGIPVVNYINII